MSPTLDAFLRSWPFDPWLLAALLLTAGVYLRGWLVLRRRDPRRWHGGRLAAFLGGLAAIYLALASPIEPFAALLLQVHMVQHLLLMMVAPPLLWLGAPLFPLLRGLPRPVRILLGRPVLSAPPLRRFFGRLTHPLIALLLFVAATWVWHAPPVYDLALRSNGWHYLQHACFLGTALLFWYPVVRPYPARPRWSPWLLLPVPDPGRPVEHRPGGPADLLRPPAVPLLRGGAAPGGTLPPGRPVGGGRSHVGAGLAGVPAAAVWHRRPTPVRPGRASGVSGSRSEV